MLIFMNLDITAKITLYSLNARIYAMLIGRGKSTLHVGIVMSTLI